MKVLIVENDKKQHEEIAVDRPAGTAFCGGAAGLMHAADRVSHSKASQRSRFLVVRTAGWVR